MPIRRAVRLRAKTICAFLLAALALAAGARAAMAKDPSFPQLAGYASATSAVAGETLGVHISTVYPSLTLRVTRFGVSDSVVMEVPDVPTESFATPDSAWVLGCGWPTTYTLTIPPDWTPGMYRIQLAPPGHDPDGVWNVPFVVRGSPAAPNPVLFISAVNTWEAYNAWGGHSLYEFNSLDLERAPRVSFDRPYDAHRGLGQYHFEVPFVRWFENNGFRADYATDVDLALDPTLLTGRRLLLVVGHSEYWARSAKAAIEALVDTSGNVAAFSGNTCYYQVRYDNDGRSLICYKNTDDPMATTNPESTTVRWRDPIVAEPECSLFGVMYPYCEDRADDSLRFAQPYSWITEGVEDQVGQRFGSHDVGYEFDTDFDGFSPASIVKVFSTPEPSDDGCPQTQVSTYYERQPAFGYPLTGGGFFAAASVQWCWGLDGMFTGDAPDPRLERVTTNLLHGLSQPLVITSPGAAVIRATFADTPPPPDSVLTVTAAQMGIDLTSYDPVPLTDDGAWPDSAAGDGVYSGALPLPSGRRLPLHLAYRVGAVDAHTPTDHNEFWLADVVRSDTLYVRGVDTLTVPEPVVGVGGPLAGGTWLRVTPNPFVGSLRFAWSAPGAVRGLTVLDVRGRVVATLDVPRGATALTWDGRDRGGRPLGAGVYWARARGPALTRSLRVVKLR